MTNQERLAEIDAENRGFPNVHIINGCFCNVTEDGPEPFADVPNYSDPGVMLAMLKRVCKKHRWDFRLDYDGRSDSSTLLIDDGSGVISKDTIKGRASAPTFVEAAQEAVIKAYEWK